MPDQLENMNLPADPLDVRDLVDLFLLEALDGDVLLGVFVESQLYFPEGPVAKVLF